MDLRVVVTLSFFATVSLGEEITQWGWKYTDIVEPMIFCGAIGVEGDYQCDQLFSAFESKDARADVKTLFEHPRRSYPYGKILYYLQVTPFIRTTWSTVYTDQGMKTCPTSPVDVKNLKTCGRIDELGFSIVDSIRVALVKELIYRNKRCNEERSAHTEGWLLSFEDLASSFVVACRDKGQRNCRDVISQLESGAARQFANDNWSAFVDVAESLPADSYETHVKPCMNFNWTTRHTPDGPKTCPIIGLSCSNSDKCLMGKLSATTDNAALNFFKNVLQHEWNHRRRLCNRVHTEPLWTESLSSVVSKFSSCMKNILQGRVDESNKEHAQNLAACTQVSSSFGTRNSPRNLAAELVDDVMKFYNTTVSKDFPAVTRVLEEVTEFSSGLRLTEICSTCDQNEPRQSSYGDLPCIPREAECYKGILKSKSLFINDATSRTIIEKWIELLQREKDFRYNICHPTTD